MRVIRDSGQQTMQQVPQPSPAVVGDFNAPPINITLNFYGDEEPGRVKQAVIDAGRKVQKTFAEQMEAYQRERRRLAFE